MLGIGLIGLGQHGSRYVRHIVKDLTDARLVAVCRRSHAEGAKVAATYGCTFHNDYRDLVATPMCMLWSWPCRRCSTPRS
jgi:predicted dehydrogenase